MDIHVKVFSSNTNPASDAISSWLEENELVVTNLEVSPIVESSADRHIETKGYYTTVVAVHIDHLQWYRTGVQS